MPVFFLVVFLAFRSDIRRVLGVLADRLHSGALLKIGSFEVGAVEVDRVKLGSGTSESREDDGVREEERNDYYSDHRYIMLAHKLARSRSLDQTFNILIYLIPHGTGTLASVSRVEYYFGRYWHKAIYVSASRSIGFPVRLSAYGPFLCTAKLLFTDGGSAMLHRYIDFEMGNVAPSLPDGE